MMANVRRVVEKVKTPRKEMCYCEQCEREINEYQYIKGYGLCPDCQMHPILKSDN